VSWQLSPGQTRPSPPRPQHPSDAIWAKMVPLGFVASGAGIITYGITQFLFGESGQ
jgi:hypothetical protein